MGQRILVVEDEKDIILVLRMALEKEGYVISEANDGIEALERVQAEKPDLILLDIMMPKLDGYTVNVRLKDNPETAKIPVIIITGRGQVQEMLKLREELKSTAYLEKPFTVAMLLEKIKELLGPPLK
jgi:CheY-like chemotaxis protein